MSRRYPSKIEQILRRFYEPLVLLRVLEPTREAIKPDLVSDRGLNEQAKLWRDFLDSLSFLCDFVHGGDTVTAIATQRTFDRPVFWLASNSTARDKARDHLEWMLRTLQRLYGNSVSDKEVEDELFQRCIRFSFRRVRKYAKWLQEAIGKARHQKRASMTDEDERLFQSLEVFEASSDDYHQICTLAHKTRYEEIMIILSKRHNAQDQRNVWSDMRHNLGRLGMWVKDVRILVRAAHRFPQNIENALVEVIKPLGQVDIPNAEYLTDFAGLINRMVPQKDEVLAEGLNQALGDLNLSIDIGKTFHEAYRDLSPRPHAELLVLEKFYYNDFDFVHDDRYIGCSKPSCYCCHLYIQCHPGQFSPRPFHGNLWMNWAPIIPLSSMVSPKAGGQSPLRIQQHHSFQILQKMLETIRRDLQEQIMSKRPKRDKHPDSSSGLSSVLNRIHQFNQDHADSGLKTTSTTTDFSIESPPSPSYRGESSAATTPIAKNWTMHVSDDSDAVQLSDADEFGVPKSLIDNSRQFPNKDDDDDDDDDDDEIIVFKGRKV